LYEVFLISRIREEYLKHGDTRRAVAEGLAKTARVITAAAAIMVGADPAPARCRGAHRHRRRSVLGAPSVVDPRP
jgi:hypothetical protein